ncbi:acyl-CoA dehydrogenase family protein [Spirillospora sp. CA-255316]
MRGDLTHLVDRVSALAGEHAGHADETAQFPVTVVDELRRGGLLGLMVPAEHGGLGGDVGDLLDVSIALGRADLSVALVFAMHCQQVVTLLRHASTRLTGELLPLVAQGRLYLASVTTESGKGGHLLTADARLAADSGRLHVDRFAPVVTGGEHADGYLITMRAPKSRSPREVSLVYAHRSQLDVEARGPWDPLGMRASHSTALHVNGTVPEHQVVGGHGQFREVAVATYGPLAHLGWAACWLGAAAGALSRVVGLLRAPDGRGGVNLESELLLSRLSRARQRIDTVHALLRHTAHTYDTGTEAELTRPSGQLLINALKITASEECLRTVEDLIDAVGMRHGYLKGSPTRLERALRDLWSASLNYHNDRLHLADGRLTLLDPAVRLV